MPIPWLIALRAIPWGPLLANAPMILRSANALRSRAQVRPDEAAAATDAQALGARLFAIEQRDRDTADVIAQLTAQVDALTTATEVLEARARWLLVIAVGALALSAVAAGLTLLRG